MVRPRQTDFILGMVFGVEWIHPLFFIFVVLLVSLF